MANIEYLLPPWWGEDKCCELCHKLVSKKAQIDWEGRRFEIYKMVANSFTKNGKLLDRGNDNSLLLLSTTQHIYDIYKEMWEEEDAEHRKHMPLDCCEPLLICKTINNDHHRCHLRRCRKCPYRCNCRFWGNIPQVIKVPEENP